MNGNEAPSGGDEKPSLYDNFDEQKFGISDEEFFAFAHEHNIYKDAPEADAIALGMLSSSPLEPGALNFAAEYRGWYGQRWCPQQSKFDGRQGRHAGVDLFVRAGTRLQAWVKGSVQWNPRNDPRGWGNHLFLNFTFRGAPYTFVYAHLQGAIGRFPRAVTLGEYICASGCTGNAGEIGSFCGGQANRCGGASDHLHLELFGQNGRIDPISFLGWNVRYSDDRRCFQPDC
jgi:murein DD-endopeptidase MepM/ murein hydrolase activator NlpD